MYQCIVCLIKHNTVEPPIKDPGEEDTIEITSLQRTHCTPHKLLLITLTFILNL